VKDLGQLTTGRYENPLLLMDWVFNLTSKGRRFKEAADIVHNQAEQVSGVGIFFVIMLSKRSCQKLV